MRLFHLLPPGLLFSLATTADAFEIPSLTSLSLPISLQEYISPAFGTNNTAQKHTIPPAGDLRRRDGSCPKDFHACTNLGAPSLCCANAAICTPDESGNPACCPSNAVCTGVVSGAITTGTVNSVGSLITGGATTGSGSGGTTSPTPTSAGYTTTTGGVIIQSNGGSTASASSRAVVIGGGNGGGSPSQNSGAMGRIEIPILARVIQRLVDGLML